MRGSRAIVGLGLGVAVCALMNVAPSGAAAPPGRYEIVGSTVLDTKTKLTWLREVPAGAFDWTQTKNYCSSLDVGGKGWRLPNMKELLTLIDETASSPAIDVDAFPNTPSNSFWTSSPEVSSAGHVIWTVDFVYGTTGIAPIDNKGPHIRCVR